MHQKLIINTDGGARGNPGPAGAGVVVADKQGKIISRLKKYLGEATNNSAEYQALILALQEAGKESGIRNQESGKTELEIRMDSELVVKQMQGKYKIKEPQLKIFAAEVLKLLKNFYQVQFKHVPREQNKEADKLVNEAIDEALKV